MVEIIKVVDDEARDHSGCELVTRCVACRYWEVRWDDYAYGECRRIVPGQTVTMDAQFYCGYGRE